MKQREEMYGEDLETKQKVFSIWCVHQIVHIVNICVLKILIFRTGNTHLEHFNGFVGKPFPGKSPPRPLMITPRRDSENLNCPTLTSNIHLVKKKCSTKKKKPRIRNIFPRKIAAIAEIEV